MKTTVFFLRFYYQFCTGHFLLEKSETAIARFFLLNWKGYNKSITVVITRLLHWSYYNRLFQTNIINSIIYLK